jgi:hypothetical protein
MPGYAILFMLLAVVLIAAYFYLMRAKARDAGKGATRGDERSVRPPD